MRHIIVILLVVAIPHLAPAEEAKINIGPGGELIVGGFDPNTADPSAQIKSLEASLPKLKSLGMTSHEVYVRWNLCEVEPGKWDWSVYDRFVEVYKKNNIKWVPFLICGSPYSLPDWYYKKRGSQGYICLQHHEESDVQSLWNPEMRRHVAEFIKAFCEHYRDTGTIEAMLLGVSGNYGECLYPVTGNDWTADRHGKYHSHPGMWAGDPFAIKDFAAWVKKKYPTTEKLKAAWGAKAPAVDDVKPFLRKDAPSDRAWIDFVDWYTGSMTDYARFWITETRKNFPTGGIYLCTGGHAPPNHGADFGDQCKVAAEVGGGVRITNEASDYAKNFTYTRWVASAGEQYGAYFSFEPAGNVDANGVVSRVYNATASGAKGLHYYFPNLLSTPAATDNFIRMGGMFQQHKPVVEIGVYYPTTQIKLEEHADTYIYKTFFGATASLRDRFDFNYVSDHMIADGGLARCKALVLVEASVMEAQTWKAIADWVKAGGLLIRADGDGKLRTVDGDETMFDVIQKHLGELGKGALLSIDAKSDSEKFQQFAADVLAKAPQLSAQSRGMVAADGKADGLFVTLLESGELLWFNSTDHEQSTASGIKIPAVSIVSKPAHTAR